MPSIDYEAINRAKWDERAPVHAASADYKIKEYVSDPAFIGEIVGFDRPLLGDVTGLNCVHLQCHIGTDTLSLARLGAASVTGLDFSGASLAEGRRLAESTAGSGGEKLRFVEASVYDGLEVLTPGSFDLVFTGIGALCWIPTIREWARVVSGLLKPGGRLFIREAHPVLWTIDDEPDNGAIALKHPYFEHADEPVVSNYTGTYVDYGDHVFKTTKSIEFNHGLGEIIQALIDEGMRITGLVEHASVPWNAIPGSMEDIGGGEMRLKDRPERMPHSYTLQAVKE